MGYYQDCAIAKPEPRKRTKARKDRAEAKVEKAVRSACVERDGFCRYGFDALSDPLTPRIGGECGGESQWAHIETRARTRKMKPELRHNTATGVILCQRHHDRLDGRDKPRLHVTLLTGRGADGPLQWRTS